MGTQGFFSGLLKPLSRGILERKQQAYAEDVKADEARIARLQNEMSSPYFNPEHMTDILAEIDEIAANKGQRKQKPRKPGAISAIVGGLQSSLGLDLQQREQPAPSNREGRFYTPQEKQDIEFKKFEREEGVKQQGRESIETLKAQSRRLQLIGRGVDPLEAPLGTMLADGRPFDPKEFEGQKIDIFVDGTGQHVAYASRVEDLRPNAQLSGWTPDPSSTTGFTHIVKDQKGNVIEEQKDRMPPAGMLPHLREGFITVVQEDGTIRAIPMQSTTGPVLPGGLPEVPGPPSPGPGARVSPPGTDVGKRPPAASESGLTPGQIRQRYMEMESDILKYAQEVQADEDFTYRRIYPDLAGNPNIQDVARKIAERFYRADWDEIQRGARGEARGQAPAVGKIATQQDVLDYARDEGISADEARRRIESEGYRVQ